MDEGPIALGSAWRTRLARCSPIFFGDLLALAAARVFALMAAITQLDPPAAERICSGALPAVGMSGMAVMYALMALFHLPPWFRLYSRTRASVDV